MNSDLINALFEFGAAICLWGNVLQLFRDKIVRGVRASTTVFFTAWGYWNIYFYPANGFPLSFAAGLFVVAANTVWVIAVVVFRIRRSRKYDPTEFRHKIADILDRHEAFKASTQEKA